MGEFIFDLIGVFFCEFVVLDKIEGEQCFECWCEEVIEFYQCECIGGLGIDFCVEVDLYEYEVCDE